MANKNFVDKSGAETEVEEPIDFDVEQLKHLGYKQYFPRTIGALDSFASSISTLNFIGSARGNYFVGLLAGGPLAMWTSFLFNALFACISSAILGEICSALPLSGSIYIWASAAAGTKYGRLAGLVVAWWVATAWTTVCAFVCQICAGYVLSLIPAYGLDFPGGTSNDNIKWRVLIWIVSEGFLVLFVIINYLPPRRYSVFFRLAMVLMLLDFVLCLIWLPIGASRRYGLRTAREALLTTYNGTGTSPGWNWMLSILYGITILAGYDVAGHVAEETKGASTIAARNIFRSTMATAVGGFLTTVLFLFCTPNLETLFSLNAPQPFVLIYAMALGRGGAVFMTIIAVLSAAFSGSIIVLAAARIIFAIARDGALPFSGWVMKVTPDGRPHNAVMVVAGLSAVLSCTVIPSAAAFTSLLSAGTLPLLASYGLIALLRLTMTPNGFGNTKFPLGRTRKLWYFSSAVFHALAVAVLVSPFYFPVFAMNLNFAGIVFSAVTIFGLISYWIIPEERWLSQKKIQEMHVGASCIS